MNAEMKLAKQIWKIGYDAALKINPLAPMRQWKDHERHIVAGFLAIATWHKTQMEAAKLSRKLKK